jgi:hypothetical protein
MSTAEEEQGQESRVRWLFVGRFRPEPTGTAEVIAPDRAAHFFAAAPLALEVAVAPDRLGAGERRTLRVGFGKLTDLKLAEVIRANPELGKLRALAEEVGAGRRPVAQAAADVEALVGAGRLSRAVADAGAGKQARDAIEQAVFDTAREALAAPPLGGLEAAWRGLRLVAERAGKEIEITILDVAPDTAVVRVDAELAARASFDRPDAVFFVEPMTDPEAVRVAANLGADYSVPVVVEGTPALLGAASGRELALGAPADGAPESWNELRADDAARFCCLTLNRLVVATDGAGARARAAFGSPTFAVAALLTQSFVATGGPGRVFGAPGGLVAPGTAEVDTGRGEPIAIATETFFSIDTQSRLAGLGVLGLGGPRNSDRVQLSAAPMLSSARDAAPLPAQILTARTVRFAQWARDQIPPGTADADVGTIMEQAALALLFPNKEVAQLSAVVTAVEGGTRALVVRARARGEWAGVPLDVTFALPLPAAAQS